MALTGTRSCARSPAGATRSTGPRPRSAGRLAGVDTRDGRRVVAASEGALRPLSGPARPTARHSAAGPRGSSARSPSACSCPPGSPRSTSTPCPRGPPSGGRRAGRPARLLPARVERAGLKPGTSSPSCAGPIGLMLCACATDAGGYVAAVGGRTSGTRSRRLSARGRPTPPTPTCHRGRRDAEARREALDSSSPAAPSLLVGWPGPGADRRRRRSDPPRGADLCGAVGDAPAAFPCSARLPGERRISVGAARHARGAALDGVADLLADPPEDYLKAAVHP